MGMYDNVIVNNDNKLGIIPGCYQSKDFCLGLDSYLLKADGQLRLESYGTSQPERYHWVVPESLPKNMTNINGIMHIYKDGNIHYYVNMVDGKAISLTDFEAWDNEDSDIIGLDMEHVIYKDVEFFQVDIYKG